mmetsp:Transcript_4595/g.11866  ORF Transcript_4595/g.11866 Transcript_4595/m.11866 type:complete len:249 (-) Transcript_4595:641-1387(-)
MLRQCAGVQLGFHQRQAAQRRRPAGEKQRALVQCQVGCAAAPARSRCREPRSQVEASGGGGSAKAGGGCKLRRGCEGAHAVTRCPFPGHQRSRLRAAAGGGAAPDHPRACGAHGQDARKRPAHAGLCRGGRAALAAPPEDDQDAKGVGGAAAGGAAPLQGRDHAGAGRPVPAGGGRGRGRRRGRPGGVSAHRASFAAGWAACGAAPMLPHQCAVRGRDGRAGDPGVSQHFLRRQRGDGPHGAAYCSGL